MGSKPAGCSRPDSGPLKIESAVKNNQSLPNPEKEIKMIRVGKEAPDFKAPAFHNGEFTEVKLSDYKGKWVVLCFYPGDFTFV